MKKIITFLIIALSNLTYGQDNTRGWTELNAFIQQQMDIFHVPGLSACIIAGDSLVWSENFGFASLEENEPVTDQTLFGVLSIGKSLTAATAMQIRENGLLGLDQNINTILPFQVVNPHNGNSNFTVRMLMSHSSSIRDYNFENYTFVGDPVISLGYFMQNYLSPGSYYSTSNYYQEVPGTNYHYCNIGPGLTGYVVEVITQTSFKDYARDSLMAPLDMLNSGWFLADIDTNNLATGYDFVNGNYQPNPFYGHMAYPGVTLRSSALELANYVTMLLNHGMFNGIEVMQEASVEMMTTVQNPAWGGSFGKPGLGLYYRTDLGNREVWGHNGGSTTGYAAQIYFCPEENTGIVVTTNSNQYVDPVVIKLLDYAALVIMPEEATNITESGFTANWQHAPGAITYYLDLSYDSLFFNFVNGYQNLDVGLVDSIKISDLQPGKSYYYRLRATNGQEIGPNSGTIHASTLFVGFSDFQHMNKPLICTPNPASDLTMLSFEIPSPGKVNIELLNNSGYCFKNWVIIINKPGPQVLELQLRDLLSGFYFIRLQSGNFIQSCKIIKM